MTGYNTLPNQTYKGLYEVYTEPKPDKSLNPALAGKNISTFIPLIPFIPFPTYLLVNTSAAQVDINDMELDTYDTGISSWQWFHEWCTAGIKTFISHLVVMYRIMCI
ncbi:MAG TPA: hypothetical protein VHT73_05980 [Thermodesulfobacteriota bacterium]|nr:hypothetical protein [Thermodesulfobacteriota bacterium]